MGDVGALIVASASGSGFGGALALGRWGEGSVLEHVAGVVGAAGVDDMVVVLGPRADGVLASSDLGEATIIIDPEWAEGTSSALRAGLDTLWRRADITTALIVDLERPAISATTLSSLLAAHRTGTRPITLPKYRYARGGPVALRRELWPPFMGLEGEVDLIELIGAHKDWAVEVWIDRIPPSRVRTPADLEAVASRR